MSFNVSAAADELRACRTTSAIKAFRARLSKDQAQAVIRQLTPTERGAVLLAMHFGGTMGRGNWEGPADATIVDTLEVHQAQPIDGGHPGTEDTGCAERDPGGDA
jgi:hypothetical protein